MERLSFKLQVATPLFLSGVDQQIVELRPPSICEYCSLKGGFYDSMG